MNGIEPKTSRRCLLVLVVVALVIATVLIAVFSWQAYQWKNVALEALTLNERFIETNDALLDMLEERDM